MHLWLPAGMEQAYHQVRVLLFVDDFHPFFGGGLQLLETQSGSQSVGHPSDDVRREQSQHSNLEAVAFQYNIRSEIRLAGRLVDDIGANHGHFQLGIESVEHLAACLNVVISNAYRIVREIIQHFGNEVGMLGVLVGAILERCALHIVAVVQKNQFFAQFGFHLFDEESIVGELVVTPMRVGGFNEGQSGFFGCARGEHCSQKGHKHDFCFHNDEDLMR